MLGDGQKGLGRRSQDAALGPGSAAMGGGVDRPEQRGSALLHVCCNQGSQKMGPHCRKDASLATGLVNTGQSVGYVSINL